MGFFDPLSFLIGSGVGLAAGAGGMYVLKDRLALTKSPSQSKTASAQGATPESSSAPREFFSPQGEKRYREEMGRFFRHRHLPGKQIDLRDVLVEPRFLKGRPPILMLEEDESGILVETDIYRVIPMLHQFPALYASFHMDTISLQDFETGHPHVAILGIPGSGKSTALSILGLIALGEISLENYRDQDRLQFDAEEDANLSEEVRERRQREREEVQTRAITQLRELQKRDEEVAALAARDEAVNLDALFPIYIHVHDLDLDPASYGGTIDPSEPLVQAIFRYLSRTTAIVSSPLLYSLLRREKGCLILVDGIDELNPEERAPYLEWLAAFREYYGQHLIVVAGPATGYDPLLNIGLAPAFIVPPDQLRVDQLIQKWVENWHKVGNLPSQNELQSLYVDNRNRNVLDLTMKVWGTLQGDIHETGRRGYYEIFVRHQTGEIENAEEVLRALAAAWLTTGITPVKADLLQLAAQVLGVEVASTEQPFTDTKEKKGKKSDSGGDGLKQVEALLKKLSDTELIHTLPNGSLAFCHPVVAWYLAGETLQGASPTDLASVADRPNWHGALGFATAIVDLEPTVLQKMRSQPDLLYSNMFSVVDWIPDAPNNLRWVTEILKRLGAAVLAPNQFPAMREYAVAALVSARDTTGGVVYIMRQAVRSGNSDLRRLGCLGLGALGAEEAISDISQMLYDSVTEVQLAAGLALGAIGTEDALRAMTEALLGGDQNLRKAVAEAFAAIPGEGHAILHDGIQHEDLEVRRACAFGLARIPLTWSIIDLYRAMLEDSQWYVREAAKKAFAHAREPRRGGPEFYPEPVAYEWLIQWAAKRGEAVPEGTGGRQVLMTALQEAPSRVRVEAARALGSLSHITAVKVLYTTLTDADAGVRIASFDALGRISNRLGKPMPGVA